MDNRAMIQRSLDYIEDNLQTEITAAELAEMAHISLFHYYRLFQQATGLYKAFCREFGATPSEFLKSCRAKRPYRINLQKEEHMTVTHKKAALILKHWNLDSEIITDIYYEGTGNKNDSACYVGEEFVLKYTANLGKLKNHMDVSKAIESIGLLAAVLVETADGQEYVQDGELYFYLTKRLPGKQRVSHSFGEGDGRFVGEIIGQLHLALSKVDACISDADLLSTVRDWALPKAKEAISLPDGFCKEYLKTFAALYPKLPRQIIHRDPNPGNIICADDQWGFIDFDLSERNVRIYDPCYAATAVLSECFGKDDEKWMEMYRNIICGYDSVAHLTDDERKAVPYVILANQLVCVAWFAGQDKYAELFKTNKRMTEWLLSKFEELNDI